MIFASVCSGIEAASVAWKPLGWRPVLYSEIEAFPRAVLVDRHRAEDVRRSRHSSAPALWPDFTSLRPRHWRRMGLAWPDVLVAGTPCQDFSDAGKRAGLGGARGRLTMDFARLADAIDNARRHDGLPGLIVVWENVPGVLGQSGNAFGHFIGTLVGNGTALVPGRRRRWSDAGMAVGPKRAAAWRVLDAQFFGLAQRRRRVFVVCCSLDRADPAEILFEPQGGGGDHCPGPAATAQTAGTLGGHARGSGWRIGGDEAAAGHIVGVIGANGRAAGSATLQDVAQGHVIPCTVGTLAPGSGGGCGPDDGDARAGDLVAVAGTLGTRPDRGGPGAEAACSGLVLARPLTAHGGPSSRLDGDSETFVAVTAPPLTTNQYGDHESREGLLVTLNARQDPVHRVDGTGPLSASLPQAESVASAAGVRRLLPVECERLQGFPDNFTDIRFRRGHAPDGHRYAAIGNSKAVPVVAWIGRRIERALSGATARSQDRRG